MYFRDQKKSECDLRRPNSYAKVLWIKAVGK